MAAELDEPSTTNDRRTTNDERGPRGDRRESGGAGKTTNESDGSLVGGRWSL